MGRKVAAIAAFLFVTVQFFSTSTAYVLNSEPLSVSDSTPSPLRLPTVHVDFQVVTIAPGCTADSKLNRTCPTTNTTVPGVKMTQTHCKVDSKYQSDDCHCHFVAIPKRKSTAAAQNTMWATCDFCRNYCTVIVNGTVLETRGFDSIQKCDNSSKTTDEKSVCYKIAVFTVTSFDDEVAATIKYNDPYRSLGNPGAAVDAELVAPSYQEEFSANSTEEEALGYRQLPPLAWNQRRQFQVLFLIDQSFVHGALQSGYRDASMLLHHLVVIIQAILEFGLQIQLDSAFAVASASSDSGDGTDWGVARDITDAQQLLETVSTKLAPIFAQAVRGAQLDAVQFITSRLLDDLHLGQAWLGGACDPTFAFGIVRRRRGATLAQTALAMAHELGHLIGMRHRSSSCTNCIMMPTIGNVDDEPSGFRFGSDSTAEFTKFISKRPQCLATISIAEAKPYDPTKSDYEQEEQFMDDTGRLPRFDPLCWTARQATECSSNAQCQSGCSNWTCRKLSELSNAMCLPAKLGEPCTRDYDCRASELQCVALATSTDADKEFRCYFRA